MLEAGSRGLPWVTVLRGNEKGQSYPKGSGAVTVEWHRRERLVLSERYIYYGDIAISITVNGGIMVFFRPERDYDFLHV